MRRGENLLPPGVSLTWEGVVVATEVTDIVDPRRLGVVGTAGTVARRIGVGGRGFKSVVWRRFGSIRLVLGSGEGGGVEPLPDFSLPMIHHVPEALVATR